MIEREGRNPAEHNPTTTEGAKVTPAPPSHKIPPTRKAGKVRRRAEVRRGVVSQGVWT